jgi:hypothetical protein
MRRNDNPPAYTSEIGRALILLLYAAGFPMHRIATLFDENPGRISETLGRQNKPGNGEQELPL